MEGTSRKSKIIASSGQGVTFWATWCFLRLVFCPYCWRTSCSGNSDHLSFRPFPLPFLIHAILSSTFVLLVRKLIEIITMIKVKPRLVMSTGSIEIVDELFVLFRTM